MKKRIITVLAAVFLLSGCITVDNGISNNLLSQNENYEKHEMENPLVQDHDDLYDAYASADIKTVYLTAGYGNKSDATNFTWDEVMLGLQSEFYEEGGEFPACEVVFQIGNENGPVEGEFGYGELSPNATIRLQGATSAANDQKNYRLTIKEGMGKLDGMKEFSLVKSFTDPLRTMNKLMHELMTLVPGVLSTRTQLVRLYVKDLSDESLSVEERAEQKFIDYGLYTMVEPINKPYLKARGIDTSGELYKAKDFDFRRHPDEIRLSTDGDFSKEAFERILEPRDTVDHTKLIEMLDAVNDENNDIETVIDEYFDKDNLYSFLAFHILTGNKKNATSDFYLYSPTGSSKFFFISWDNDGAFRSIYKQLKNPEYNGAVKNGVFAYADSVLFTRICRNENTRKELSLFVDEIYEKYLTPDNIQTRLERLTEAVKPVVYSLPDRNYMRVTEKVYDKIVEEIPFEVEENYYLYYDSLEGAWPFHLLKPATNGGELTLNWEDSFCSVGDVKYIVEVDDGWDFDKPIISMENVEDNFITIDMLPAGQYFLRVTANSPMGVKTPAIENYYTEKKSTAYGVLCFYVTADGKAVASYVENQE